MQSPRIEWTLGIGYLAVLDWVRNQGEPDSDTLTEVIREAFGTDHAPGRRRLAVTIAAGGVVLYRHLTKPCMRGLSS